MRNANFYSMYKIVEWKSCDKYKWLKTMMAEKYLIHEDTAEWEHGEILVPVFACVFLYLRCYM